MKLYLTPSKYLLLILIFILFVVTLFYYCWRKNDHFAAIPLNGSSKYYRNYNDRITREIQDRDIFYNNIGKSIKYAKKADIILLGHSMLLWGLREDLIKKFEKKHGIKIYNLAMAGDASGEFLRLIIKRWHLKPKLWIINADDHAANFFSKSFDDFGGCTTTSSIATIKYNRIMGFTHVVGRNVQWRLEDLVEHYLPKKITKFIFPGPGLFVWRNAENGNWFLENVPAYNYPDNALIKLTRIQECHTNDTEIKLAKDYLKKIGSNTILTLVPYHEFCAERVKELAIALETEYIIPPNINYSSVDGGGHLDKKGAIAFTNFLLDNLEKTAAFNELIAKKNQRVS
ncbi:MAG TPA: hypothetical protein VHM20_03605 [Gammaproteobacteria bacterium]|jgi:hypothetical protein|nr:hypothetical protein [Gammaproteobacteria bacterium]